MLQVQAYNRHQRSTTSADVPDVNCGTASLHDQTGFDIGLFALGLRQRIPGVTDNPGRPVPFASHRIEIIASGTTNKAVHMVAITYTTGTLTLFRTAGNYLLPADSDQQHTARQQAVFTYLLELQPHMSVSEYALQGPGQ